MMEVHVCTLQMRGGLWCSKSAANDSAIRSICFRLIVYRYSAVITQVLYKLLLLGVWMGCTLIFRPQANNTDLS